MSEFEFTPQKIAKLRDLASKATPRPWGFYDAFSPVDKPGFVNFTHFGTGLANVIQPSDPDYRGDMTVRGVDAGYLHEATNLLPAALDEIEQLRARVTELEEALAWYADTENYLTVFEKPGQLVWNVMYEGGERARNALKGGE